ncbi:MAG: intradiol ring-cleavage dioxygenase [Acidimicrobiia bacterium]
MQHPPDNHDRGLAFDLATMLERRRALKLLAGLGLVALVGCGGDDETAAGDTTTTSGGSSSTSATSASGTGSTSGANCTEIPGETAGPYPGDGSNGPNILSQSGIVRSDIRSSIGSASGVAEGVPLAINLAVLDAGKSCAALAGAAVYLWHCDREGRYSMYSEGAADENYLRGVQQTDADGKVTFQSIFPAAYSGRWPHIHFEIYPSLDKATSAAGKMATSQLAFPADVCQLVYATTGYSASVRNLAQTSLERDMVFSDGATSQLATCAGDTNNGYTAELAVRVTA